MLIFVNKSSENKLTAKVPRANMLSWQIDPIQNKGHRGQRSEENLAARGKLQLGPKK